MKKTLSAVAAAATIGLGAIAAPTSANAQWHHHHGGGAVAAGVLGGLAAGAIVGSAVGAPYYGYPAGAYAYGPGYGDGCYLRRERFWTGWGWRIRHVRVCY